VKEGTPKPPAIAASPPWTPSLPTIVGLGLARVLSLSEAEKGKPRQIFPLPCEGKGAGGWVGKAHPQAPWQGLALFQGSFPYLPPLSQGRYN